MRIVTVQDPDAQVLRTVVDEIGNDELPLAHEIANQLYLTLKPHLPAAGLAAPQIGISKAVFIYSYDRTEEHLEVVINPSFEGFGEKEAKWEGCFSAILCKQEIKIAKVPRYKTIEATYQDLNGKICKKKLEGFAAKVFQHEWDHLQGIVNIDRHDAEIRSFDSKEAMLAFMQQVKLEDAKYYNPPSV